VGLRHGTGDQLIETTTGTLSIGFVGCLVISAGIKIHATRRLSQVFILTARYALVMIHLQLGASTTAGETYYCC
jgi:hypothetical protein